MLSGIRAALAKDAIRLKPEQGTDHLQPGGNQML